jgi:hypothetical protein
MLEPGPDADKSTRATRKAFVAYMEKHHCAEIFECTKALLATQGALESASNDPGALKAAIATLLSVLQFENHGTYVAAAVNLTDHAWQTLGNETDLSPIANAKAKLEKLSQDDIEPDSDLPKACLAFVKQAAAELNLAMAETWREFKLVHRKERPIAHSKTTARLARQTEKPAAQGKAIDAQAIETLPSTEKNTREIHAHLTTPKKNRQTKGKKTSEEATRRKHRTQRPSRFSDLFQTLGSKPRTSKWKPLIQIDVQIPNEEPPVSIVLPPEKEWSSLLTWAGAKKWLLNAANEGPAQQCIAELLQFAKSTKSDENVEAWTKLHAIARTAESIQEAIQADNIVNCTPLNDLLKDFAEVAFYDKNEAKLNLPTDTWLLLYPKDTFDRNAAFDASSFHRYLTTSPLDNADLDDLNASLQRITKFARNSSRTVDNMMEGVWGDFQKMNANPSNK